MESFIEFLLKNKYVNLNNFFINGINDTKDFISNPVIDKVNNLIEKEDYKPCLEVIPYLEGKCGILNDQAVEEYLFPALGIEYKNILYYKLINKSPNQYIAITENDQVIITIKFYWDGCGDSDSYFDFNNINVLLKGVC